MEKTTTCCGTFPGRKLRGKDKYKRIYHFTSFESFVKIWLSKELLFSELEKVNDLFEINKVFFAESFVQMPLMVAFQDLINSYRQVSFTMDYDSYIKGCMSTAMWGLYGNKTNGVCIEIDFEKLILPKHCIYRPITYVKTLPKYIRLDSSLTCIADLRKFIKKNIQQIFFKKLDSWKPENEYRIISNEISKLDISNAISAVYLTKFDSSECLLVERLVNGEVPVKYLHFTENIHNIAIPIVSDTAKARKQVNEAKQSQTNVLNPITDQAKQFYQEHKNDEHFPLLLNSYKI